jgi:hypothetical protein
MAVADTAEDFRIGRVVSRLFNALFANLAVFLPLTALLSIPSLLLTIYTTLHPAITGIQGAQFAPGGALAFLRYQAVVLMIYFIFGYTLQAALTQGTVLYLNGESPSFGKSLSTALKAFVPIVIIGTLSFLGTIAGAMFLIIPGILLLLMWCVVIPVRIVEQTGIGESFGRSRALTKGHRGKIFLLLLMYFLLAAAIGLITRPIMGLSMIKPTPSQLNIPFVVVAWAENVLITSLLAIGVASIYYELRLVKEGIGAQQMAEAFD